MKRTPIPVLLLLGALVLSSCNSPDTADESMETPTEATLPAEALITEESPEETAPETAETSTAESEALDTASACYQPFFPIVDGVEWTYQYDTGMAYTQSIDVTGPDTFTMIQTLDGGTVLTAEWFCSEEGIVSADFAQLQALNESMGEENTRLDLSVLSWEGETLPPFEQMVPGYAWTSSYSLTGEFDIQGVTGTADSNVFLNHTITAIEEVTVPAGTFPEAYRVNSSGTIEMTLVTSDLSIPPTTIDFTYTTWYVAGLGMIKTADSFVEFSSEMVLMGSSLLE